MDIINHFNLCISISRPVFVLQGGGFRTSWVRFSALRRTRTGFLEVGVWNRFIGFWENAVGFSTALLLDFHQSGVLQFPQGVHRFLPPTMEQVNHFADRVIQENPSAVIRPPILAG